MDEVIGAILEIVGMLLEAIFSAGEAVEVVAEVADVAADSALDRPGPRGRQLVAIRPDPRQERSRARVARLYARSLAPVLEEGESVLRVAHGRDRSIRGRGRGALVVATDRRVIILQRIGSLGKNELRVISSHPADHYVFGDDGAVSIGALRIEPVGLFSRQELRDVRRMALDSTAPVVYERRFRWVAIAIALVALLAVGVVVYLVLGG